MPASDDKMTDEYIVLMRQAYAKHGPKCLILMQVGGFYEIYDNNDAESSPQLQVCEHLLYLKVTPKNMTSEIDGVSKPVYAAGFPDYALPRYKAMLVDRGYTVLVIDQDDDDPTVRRLSSVVSPGLDDEHRESDSAVAVLVVTPGSVCGARYDAAVNAINMFRSVHDQPLQGLDEARLTLREMGGATEIQMHVCSTVETNASDDQLASIFGSVAIHIRRHTASQRYLYNREWQMRCLESHFPRHHTYGEDILRKLGLEATDKYATLAVALLCIFIREHDAAAINNLPMPNAPEERESQTHFLNGSLHRLDVLSGADGPSLYDIFAKHVHTKMGLRLLRTRLCSPTYDTNALARSYDEIDAMTELARGGTLDADLRHIKDLSHIGCRIRRGRLRPNDLDMVVTSHRAALKVIEATDGLFGLQKCVEITALETMVECCQRVFDDRRRNGLDCFKEGSRVPFCDLEAVDAARASHTAAMQNLEATAARLADCIRQGANAAANKSDVRVVASQDGGYHLVTTPAKGRALQQAGVSVVSTKNQARISDTTTVEICSAAAQTRVNLDEACSNAFDSVLHHLRGVFFDRHADAIAVLVGRIDLVHGVARLSDLSRYKRPNVIDATHGAVEAYGLRHPIIERLVDARGTAYVSNDIRLDNSNSMLLYGANSVGKSSLLKAVAMAVLMAQVGFFVPAETFRLVPYKTVSLHIGGRDNMYRFQSTYVHEVEHLRAVLAASRRVGARTLFLADELGNSTEDRAALCLVSTILHAMYTRAATIVLATHMFALLDSPLVTGLRGLRPHHLKVVFPAEGGFVFERTLQVGPPEVREYGCEIAARLLEDDVDVCRRLRSGVHASETMRHPPAPRPARYNRHMYAIMGCSVCGYVPKCSTDKPVAWHHIEEQSTQINGFVPSGKGVHASSNLMPVCDDCHDDIHSGRMRVVGYEDTSDGPKLRILRTDGVV